MWRCLPIPDERLVVHLHQGPRKCKGASGQESELIQYQIEGLWIQGSYLEDNSPEFVPMREDNDGMSPRLWLKLWNPGGGDGRHGTEPQIA